ncbi:MAG: DUF3025 domain-containing protein [Pseudomonadota bacterium]|nr:DUF3025 domain-containing protein [Pseudomonadota bacterium]
MSKRRFIAPARAEVAPACFDHPIYREFQRFRGWMAAATWPSIADLNAALPSPGPCFVEQDRQLLDDGQHYETRIAEHGWIATRSENWHDLFNAMVWCRHPAIKQALNRRQCAHIAEMGPSARNRAQYALTQFDEAGVIVRVRDRSLLSAWDRHDWPALFHAKAEAWRNGDIAIIAVIGHALLELGLAPGRFIVGKALLVEGEAEAGDCVDGLAQAIATARCLNDPLELRPLPLAGIPGWHVGQDAAFYREAECFQPLRAGRVYPMPLGIGMASPGAAG